MKKKTFIVAAVATLTALSMASCNSKVPAETTSAEDVATSNDTTPSETEADPAVTELENIEVPEMPKLEDMGYIKMVDLSTITVETTPKTVVDEDMIDSQIKTLLSSYKDEVDEAAKEGDVVNIDFVGSIDGVEFDGGTGTNYDLTLGSGQFIDGFEDQLIGSKKGDKVTVNVTFPENYGKEELNGKPAVFEVTVNKVSRTPELTDEWLNKHAEDLETESKTVAEFRDEQRALLQAQIDYSYDNKIQTDALQQIVDKSEIGMSDAMKEYAEAYVMKSEIDTASQYGYGLSDMLKMYSMTVDEFKEEMGSFAADYASQRIVVATIAKEQDITATDELIENLAKQLNGLYGTKLNKVQLIERYGGDMVKDEAVNNAVLKYIQDNVKIEIKEESETSAETEAVEEESSNEETTVSNDLQGEGGFSSKSVTEVYTAASTEGEETSTATTEAETSESETSAK